MIPRATYRVQFHAGFTFADAAPLADYWADLGISHLYASPIATARKGSTHGYDVVDPSTINPHLGGEQAFRDMAAALRARGLGIILDIVPNHVAVGGEENGWWLDVLENGPASRYARFFDIDWEPEDASLRGKVLAPFLGAPYAEVLRSGDLQLEAEPDLGRISLVAYGAHRFPIRPEDHAEVLARTGAADLRSLSRDKIDAHYDGANDAARERLHALIEKQHWRLAWWRSAGDAINWRRFFDITELAGLRIEEPEVFDAVHALPLRLYAEGLIDGVRVDHVDGLADPAGYCRRLRAALEERRAERPADRQNRAYLIVEKILGAGEALSSDWEVDGTTGYEFMNEVSAVLHAPEGAEPLADFWARISGRPADFQSEEHIARQEILHRGFAGQLDTVAATLHRAGQSALETRDFGLAAFRRAAAALVESFSVYRTYGTGQTAPTADAPLLQIAVDKAIAAAPLDEAVIRLIAAWLAGQGPGDTALRADAVRRFQQLSAPIAAKSVEDTAFYRYGRLLSRNDVGFDPARFSETPRAFLTLCRERGECFPGAMLTTATHDHKRGEDVRARLSVLSEIAPDWIDRAEPWVHEAAAAGVDPADALFVLQMIVGAWPLDLTADDAEGLSQFAERVAAWQIKALREGKLRSSWAVPDETYEGVCTTHLHGLLTEPQGAATREQIAAFVQDIAPAGAAKGLVQAGLRLTLPGVPDLYQGCEFWDFSLVDPDNRRPVDYPARPRSLGSSGLDWRSGGPKQALIAELLSMRARDPDLFASADLSPLEVVGARAGSVLAFRRRHGGRVLTVAALLRTADASGLTGAPAVAPEWWGDTQLRLEGAQSLRLAEFAADRVFAAQLDAL
ncbi:malto-oligosyltrehalose synthase [Phenylobacterium deserti]|uniref:Malto-oligosyltrehalose synthase n=1 Tax=Phenylobacterium deserti TaxID=1914756 RepID=A0A328AC57_9CAUL|nr:malto-oligosyltrehalose synthase [Phenylobacterium deserti]RAK52230.1 malto-oligosyltrehalose synthase [Phenylobacterium deserti]